MHHRLLLAAAITLVATAAPAAEIVLRERAVPAGAVVRLGDVADIGAATAAERDALVMTPLAPAPARGVARHLRVGEIRDLLALRGVDVSNLHFSGATLVSIGAAPTPAAPLAAAASVPVVDAAAVQTAIEQQIVEYLRGQTGEDLWKVELHGSDTRWQELAFATQAATVSGGEAPWTGRQKFVIADRAGQRGRPIFARVSRLRQAVVAVQAIERGALISVNDVELTTVDQPLPSSAVQALENVVGQEARYAVQEGAVLTTGNLRAPIVVRRGELSTVVARAAGVVAKTLVVPQQDGSVGDLVIVQAGQGRQKRRFTARVTGYGELEVFAAATEAGDLARR